MVDTWLLYHEPSRFHDTLPASDLQDVLQTMLDLIGNKWLPLHIEKGFPRYRLLTAYRRKEDEFLKSVLGALHQHATCGSNMMKRLVV